MYDMIIRRYFRAQLLSQFRWLLVSFIAMNPRWLSRSRPDEAPRANGQTHSKRAESAILAPRPTALLVLPAIFGWVSSQKDVCAMNGISTVVTVWMLKAGTMRAVPYKMKRIICGHSGNSGTLYMHIVRVASTATCQWKLDLGITSKAN